MYLPFFFETGKMSFSDRSSRPTLIYEDMHKAVNNGIRFESSVQARERTLSSVCREEKLKFPGNSLAMIRMWLS